MTRFQCHDMRQLRQVMVPFASFQRHALWSFLTHNLAQRIRLGQRHIMSQWLPTKRRVNATPLYARLCVIRRLYSCQTTTNLHSK